MGPVLLSPPPATGDLDADKAAWREALRAGRRAVVAEQGEAGRAAQAQAIAAHALALVASASGTGSADGLTVTAYEQLRTEPPTDAMVAALLAQGARVLLPITLGSARLDWCDAADPDRAPLGREAVAGVDVALIPGLGVDRHGNRLGKGGAYYDNVLPLLRRPQVPVVVLLHDHELVAQLPAGPTDVAVDAVLTAADGVRWLRGLASG